MSSDIRLQLSNREDVVSRLDHYLLYVHLHLVYSNMQLPHVPEYMWSFHFLARIRSLNFVLNYPIGLVCFSFWVAVIFTLPYLPYLLVVQSHTLSSCSTS